MKIVENDWIPFPGFKAINLFGVIFLRTGYKLTETDLNHERIHTAQMKELWYLPFYLIYFFEWIFRLFHSGNAYRNISFEKEAYTYSYDLNYLTTRRKFAMWKS